MSSLAINGFKIESREVSDGTCRWFVDGKMCLENASLAEIMQGLAGRSTLAAKQNSTMAIVDEDEGLVFPENPPTSQQYFFHEEKVEVRQVNGIEVITLNDVVVDKTYLEVVKDAWATHYNRAVL